MAAPEPPPAPVAPLRSSWPVQLGKLGYSYADLQVHPHPTHISGSWPVSVPDVFGGSFRRDRLEAAGSFDVSERIEPIVRTRMPRFELGALVGVTQLDRAQRMRCPEAQPLERWIELAVTGARPVPIALRTPAAPAITSTYVRRVVDLAVGPEPEPVSCEARAVPDSTPAALLSGPALLRFGLNAVADASEIAAVRIPSAAGPLPTFVPVESTPETPAFAPAALAPSTGMQIPAVRPATAKGLPEPGIADVPTPQPVESMPFVPAIHPAVPATPAALRMPVVRPIMAEALPESELFEVPAAAPVESMPALPAFAPAALSTPTTLRLPVIRPIIGEVLPQPWAVVAPAPAPVESMPAVPAFAPAALAPCVSSRMPAIGSITAQVLPQAWAVEGPAPVPVESLPAVPEIVPAACDFHPALRFPTLTHVRLAEESAAALAAPVTAPGPVPVETLPAVAAYTGVALPPMPRLAAQSFAPAVHAEFGFPKVAGPAPSMAEPPAAAAKPAVLEPVARISAQPAGAQPERPLPAIPRPSLFPIEYYCQRMASVPTKRIEPIESTIALTQLPFAIRPAALGLDDLVKRKSARLILPFEQIFAREKPVRTGKRININTTGKIAAALMVGIALWTGMRLANFGQHTQDLRAQVAGSERVLAVGSSRERNFGNGTMGKFRRAIASRAATELTDDFKSGMAAWGAEKNAYAHGWKHDARGYLATGDMALFQPSLKYNDYRMEFYGQIEEKSLGWVVRAQDKKNYYAMKFTVIEPGLRPIIAMVHYGVVNGKAGHKIQTPLSVMVHNQKPIHVAVDVRGNRFTTSIDGEPVESWTDDTLAQGGVGFFSDAGERARLYWMKLSRNQDWLGRFCAYLSGDGQNQVAEVWGPGSPNQIPGPVESQAPALALAAAGPFHKRKRRNEVCNS